MKLQVECHSGYQANHRPVRFRLDGSEYQVEEVLDRWYEPESVFYKLRATDGNIYILRQYTTKPEGEWELISFRQDRERR